MEKTNTIYIPKTINVGYQYREDTYTGKLAYVTYFDADNKLRKEVSWNNWRNDDICNDIYKNIPTEGFVLNKKVGGEKRCGYDVRRTYTRVYDPRGFEFEITIQNLLYILENCNCIKGKGLEGEFVYGWDKKDLILIPVSSPDYKEITEYSNIINEKNYIKPKDLVIGYTYAIKNDENKYIYLGKYDVWEQIVNYSVNDTVTDYEKDITGFCPVPGSKRLYKNINRGQYYYFAEHYGNHGFYIYYYKDISKKITKCIDPTISLYYQLCTEKLNDDLHYNPIDYNNIIVEELPYKIFEDMLYKLKHSFRDFRILSNNNMGSISYDSIRKKYHYNKIFHQAQYFDEDSAVWDIYNKLKPQYVIYYHMDGTEYRREGWYDEHVHI